MASFKLWTALILLRVVWCTWPQAGYVDEAEFFEGTDVLAARIFGFESNSAPGYDPDRPQTTIFFRYITSGFGFHALKMLNDHGIVPINEQTLLIFPRLMTILVVSLVTDGCIFSTAKLLGLDANACLVIFASSFATLVFMTRPMTHVVCASTFAQLLMAVVSSRRSQLIPKTKRRGEKENEGEQEEEEEEEEKNEEEEMEEESGHNQGFWMGVFLLEGTFNHPAFLIFALVPTVFWLTGSTSQFGTGAIKTILFNIASILPGVVAMGTFLLILDSVFYGTLDAAILFNPQLLLENMNANILQNLTIPPVNFMQLNFLDDPVEIKPETTHVLFNLPLLFFPLLICFVSELFAIYSGSAGESRKTFTTSTSRAFLALCFTTPLIILSFLPIQDPKILLPLLIPLVFLYADYVIIPQSGCPNVPWIVWNAVIGLIFGFVLQGGVIPALADIKSTVQAPVMNGKPTMYHFVFYHTPTPPLYLMAMPPLDVMGVEGGKNLTHQFLIHDYGNMDRLHMHQSIGSLLSNSHTPVSEQLQKEIYVIAPASLDPIFCRINIKFTYKLVKRFSPHVSFELPPDLFPDYACSAEKPRSQSRMGLRTRIPAVFSLNVYKVEPVRHFGGADMEAFKKLQEQQQQQKKSKSVNQ